MNLRPPVQAIPVLLLLLAPVPAHPQPPDLARDAYLDQTARHLVTGARSTRDATRRAIRSHSALVRERLSFDAPTSRHDRPWMRGERALWVRWFRYAPTAADVFAEHFRHPGVGPSVPRYFRGLRADRLPVDPLADPFTLGLAPFMGGDAAAGAVHSPLGPDAERYYQFRSGDTTAIRLGDGETVETIAVTAIPRYRSIRLVAAIMWIEPESFGLVRAAFRPAKRIDHEVTGVLREAGGWWLGLDIDAGDTVPTTEAGTRPGWFGQLLNDTFTAVLLGIETDISSVIVDLARTVAPTSAAPANAPAAATAPPGHWLPRRVQWTGHTGIESVTATGAVAPTLPFAIDWTMDPTDDVLREPDVLPPPLAPAADLAPDTESLGSALAAIGNGAPGDTDEAASPWYLYPPVWTLNLVRYNPVEGVSMGAQVRRDFGWWRSVVTVRAATRDWKAIPDLDLTFQRDRPGLRTQLSFYRALRTGALGAGGIDGFPLPLILESDSLDFHRSTGASLRFIPGGGQRLGFSLSFFAENDEVIETAGHGEAEETPSAPPPSRLRYGAALEWKPWWGGLGRDAIGAGGTMGVRASAGDQRNVKMMFEAALALPVAAGVSLGLQAGWAGVSGDPAPQDLWDLGATGAWLRGHAEPVETSRAWMGRADLQFPARFVRLSLFGDWALAEGVSYHAAGAGLVILDGLLRVDAAQGFRRGREGGPDPAFRLHVLMDNLF